MKVDAWDSRISDIAKACNIFINESDYPIKYSDTNTTETLWLMFNDFDTGLLVDYTEDTFNGFSIVSKTNEFHEEYFGYLNKFYVLPNRRNTRAAFKLIAEAVKWFDDNECVVSFATATAGIGNDKAFIKLLTKFGYTVTTTGILTRKRYGKI